MSDERPPDDELQTMLQKRLTELLRNMPDSDKYYPVLYKANEAVQAHLWSVAHGIADTVHLHFETLEESNAQLWAEVAALKQEAERHVKTIETVNNDCNRYLDEWNRANDCIRGWIEKSKQWDDWLEKSKQRDNELARLRQENEQRGRDLAAEAAASEKLRKQLIHKDSLIAAKDAALEPFATLWGEGRFDAELASKVTYGDCRKAREARRLS